MKNILTVLLVSLLCLSMFSMLAHPLFAVNASSPPGKVDNFSLYSSGSYELLVWGNSLTNGFPDPTVTGFKIYKGGSLLSTVDWHTCRYRDYSPVNNWCQYGISAVNAAGEGPQYTESGWWSSMPSNVYYDLTVYCSPPEGGKISGMFNLRSGQITAGNTGLYPMVNAWEALGYTFTSSWTKTGSISITFYPGQRTCYIDSWWGNDATITAYFQSLPTHDVSIGAHCNSEGVDVSVPITMDGASTGYNTPHDFSSLTGSHTFTVPSTDSNGHPFTQWNDGETTTTITVSAAGAYIAYYEAPPPPSYGATVYARCNTEKIDLAVPITMDGSATGYTTPHYFAGLTGTHTFMVPSNDANGHPFQQWNTGQTSRTITVSSGGAYTAYYGAAPPPIYAATISAYDNTARTIVGVMITKDWLASGFNTPHTFPGLTGTHTFTVPSSDAFGHPFKNWNTGSNMITINVSSAGSYTAYYETLPPPSSAQIHVTPTFSAVSVGETIFYTGKVADLSGNGVSGAMVAIDDPMAQQSTVKTTDANGGFSYSTTAKKNGAFLISFSTGSLRTYSIVDVGIHTLFSAFPQLGVMNPNTFSVTAVLSVNGQEQCRVDVPPSAKATIVEFENYKPSIISAAAELCPVQLGAGSLCIDSNGYITGEVGEGIVVGAYKQVATNDFGACGGVGGGAPYLIYGDGMLCVGTDGINLMASGGLFAVGGSVQIHILSFQPSKVGQISGHSPVNLIVTDPTGKRVGFDPRIGLVNEIYGSSYTGPNAEEQMISIPVLATGEYVITVFGIDDGNYSINIAEFLANGITESSQWINGTILKGEMLVAFANGAQVSYAVDVAPLKSVVGHGYCAPVNLTIMNTGSSPENFNLTLFANSTKIDTEMISALLNGTSTTIACIWNTSAYAYGNYTISVYLKAIPGENGTAENSLTAGATIIAMIGDLTGTTPFVPDGKVDMRDIGVVARGFGSTPGTVGWSVNCDIGGPTLGVPDGKIDMLDIGLVARRFGDHYP